MFGAVSYHTLLLALLLMAWNITKEGTGTSERDNTVQISTCSHSIALKNLCGSKNKNSVLTPTDQARGKSGRGE